MAVRITKSAVNIREKLAELERPIGVNGAALMKTETPQDAFSLIGAGSRNRIINGDMRIDQRNNGSSITMNNASTAFPVDRFLCEQGSISTNTATIQRVSDAPSGFTYSIKYTAGSITFSASSAWSGINQRIEGHNVSDLKWGTPSALPVTLSFWVKSSLTGTFSINMTHYDGSVERWNNISYTINSANTWEYKTLTFVGDSSYGISNDNGTNGWMRVYWSIGDNGGNSSTTTAKNTWFNGAGAYRAITGQVNLISTTGATFYITGVQLEEGKVATPFEYRSIGEELALCQRYCYVINGSSTFNGSGYARYFMHANSGSSGISYITFPVQMRATPSLITKNFTSTYVDIFNYDNLTAATLSSVSSAEHDVWHAQLAFSFTGGTLASGHIMSWRWINVPDAYIGFVAEL